MDFSKAKYHIGNLVLFSAFFLGAILVFSRSSSSIYPFLSRTSCSCNHFENPSTVGDNLDVALASASKGNNKTVIITVVNKAYVELGRNRATMLDVFLESFWMGEETRPLVNNLLVVAVDKTAYQRCIFRGLHCYKMDAEGVNSTGEAVFMSEDFIKMMWTRTAFLLDVLKRGYSFIFTDSDVMWLRNPIARLGQNKTYDIQFSTDFFQNNVGPENQLINTGFYYIRSNKKTISLFEKWYSMTDKSRGMKEQDVLINLLKQGFLGQLGINVSFLDTVYFSGFCQDSRDVGVVVTVHANCCRSISAKVSDLTNVLGDWKRFNEVGVGNGTVGFRWTRHTRCYNSWRTPKGGS